MNNFSLGISPCPNYTYIFGALINKWIPSPIQIEKCIFEDVEFLNQSAINQKHDVIKVSYFAYSLISKNYQLLTSGGALGKNCGPLLISKFNNKVPDKDSTIAIPGINTTANLLLSLAYPECKLKKEILFSEIEEAVLNEEVDFGLIIHESRFTYEAKGLFKVLDLGEYWEEKTNCPLPLGGIAIRRNLSDESKIAVNNAVKDSIKYAFENQTQILDYAKDYAQEMDETVMLSHIQLYVNEYSLDVGDLGKKAVNLLFEEITKIFPERKSVEPIFI